MNISARELDSRLADSQELSVIDVRRKDQRNRWPLAGIDAESADLEGLDSRTFNHPTVMVCQFGIVTQRWLELCDLDNVYNLIGGAQAWISHREHRRDLSRYSRQMVLPEIGEEGQRKLLDAMVTIVGIGGLGCPASQYLAAAGIGKLQLVDGDVVDITNLQRQPLFNTENVGHSKSEAAAESLAQLNPDCNITSVKSFLGEDNCESLLSESDVVVDATDTVSARRVMDRFCAYNSIPLVYGGLYRFEGQVSVFHLNDGPSYSDLFPVTDSNSGSCSDEGVPGMLPGIIGSIQALEALKIILAIEPNLSGKLLLYDCLTHAVEQIELKG
jgi:adenylyltransferase/sulfurtransferase